MPELVCTFFYKETERKSTETKYKYYLIIRVCIEATIREYLFPAAEYTLVDLYFFPQTDLSTIIYILYIRYFCSKKRPGRQCNRFKKCSLYYVVRYVLCIFFNDKLLCSMLRVYFICVDKCYLNNLSRSVAVIWNRSCLYKRVCTLTQRCLCCFGFVLFFNTRETFSINICTIVFTHKLLFILLPVMCNVIEQ